MGVKFKAGDIIRVTDAGNAFGVNIIEITGYELEHQANNGGIMAVYNIVVLAGNDKGPVYGEMKFMDIHGTKIAEANEITRKLYSD